MKKKLINIFVIISVLMLTGCGNSTNEEKSNEADHQTTETAVMTDSEEVPIENTIDTEDIPFWATETSTNGTLFQNLNLDGVGDFDDEAYVSVLQFGDYEDKVTALRIHLGTGETMAKIFPVYGDYSFQTGKLFSDEKDAIILEIQVPASNYGAATVYALDVFPVGVDPIPTTVIRLDTTESILLADGTVIESSLENTDVTSGTKVVDTEDMQQGISIYFTGEKGHYQEIQRTFYWTDNGWEIQAEEVQE